MSQTTESAETTRRSRQNGQAGANGEQKPTNEPTPAKLRRRPALIALSVLLIALGALLAAWLVSQLVSGQSVVAIRNDIPRGTQIHAEDLAEARMSSDDQISALPWSRRNEIIGKYADIDFRKGGIVSGGTVTEQAVPSGNDSLVGLVLPDGRRPSTELRVGDQVRVIQAGEAVNPDVARRNPIKATVAAVSATEGNSGNLVDVLITNDQDAQTVARWAGSNAVAVTREPVEAK
ncbi:SAF domain-containing protein [Kribbia dieselivorans]|uniref:SAF domain-containing protein n=1 Tax=Kribbia dieselivorans TaxID=331526 RepID=UPI000B103B24|nr:SAF domain-containing protein [Kribbia dieselivorans]